MEPPRPAARAALLLALAAGCAGNPPLVDWRERQWEDVKSPMPVVPAQYLPHDLASYPIDNEDVQKYMKDHPEVADYIRTRPHILATYNRIWDAVREAVGERFRIRESRWEDGFLKTDEAWIGGTGGAWRFAAARVIRITEFGYDYRVWVFRSRESHPPEAVVDPALTEELKEAIEARLDM